MWPFKRKAVRGGRTLPSVPYVDGDRWAAGAAPTYISPTAAEGLAAVLCAVNAIASTIAGLPAYVVTANDAREEVPTHPLMRLIRDGVNETESWGDFLEGLLASALLRGNALAEISTDAGGRLDGLRTVPWANVTPWIDDQGALLFDYLPPVPPAAGRRHRLLREDVLYLKDRSDGGYVGVPRISRAAGSMQSALQLQTSTVQFMGNAVRPSGSLATSQRISEDAVTRLQQEWDEAYRGAGTGKVAVLHSGLEFKPLSLLTPEDAQWIEQRNFSVADVARLFGVPPFILADPSRMTFASSREASRQFAQQSLLPWVAKIERAFQQTVLAPNVRLVIDLGDLLRADPEARWASWLRARQAGILSPNDIRTEEGWPASSDPTANSIQPPAMGGAKPVDDRAPKPSPTPADDEKIARLGQQRA